MESCDEALRRAVHSSTAITSIAVIVTTTVVARLDRAIQYAEPSRKDTTVSGILGHPPPRVVTTECVDAMMGRGWQ
jgi:hypothetical protein